MSGKNEWVWVKGWFVFGNCIPYPHSSGPVDEFKDSDLPARAPDHESNQIEWPCTMQVCLWGGY